MGNLFQPKLFWQWKRKLINIERPYIIFPIIGLRCCIYNRPHSFRQNENGGLNGVAQQCWMAAGNVTDGTFPSLNTWHYAQLSNHCTRSQMFCLVFIFLNFQLGNSPGEVDLTRKAKNCIFKFFSFSLAIVSYVVECFTSQRGGTPLNADWWRSPAHVKGQCSAERT